MVSLFVSDGTGWMERWPLERARSRRAVLCCAVRALLTHLKVKRKEMFFALLTRLRSL